MNRNDEGFRMDGNDMMQYTLSNAALLGLLTAGWVAAIAFAASAWRDRRTLAKILTDYPTTVQGKPMSYGTVIYYVNERQEIRRYRSWPTTKIEFVAVEDVLNRRMRRIPLDTRFCHSTHAEAEQAIARGEMRRPPFPKPEPPPPPPPLLPRNVKPRL